MRTQGTSRTKATTIWLAVALVVLGLGATAASAVVIAGRGELHAMGDGFAALDLRGVLRVRGGGILVADRGAIVELDGRGRCAPVADGRAVCEGFGEAVVRSVRQRTHVEIAGAHLRLHAKGAGRALLRGTGIFHTDDVDGAWADEAEVEFEGAEGY